jgi:hypothetical protein
MFGHAALGGALRSHLLKFMLPPGFGVVLAYPCEFAVNAA